MKVAVCFSGCVRTMHGLVNNHRDHLLDLYDCDVFFSFWDHWGEHAHRDSILPIEEQRISEYWKNKLVELYKPVAWEFEDYNSKKTEIVEKSQIFKDSPNYGDVNTFSMYYKIQKCYNLMAATGRKYDVVLRIRPDIKLTSALTFKVPEENKVYTDTSPIRAINNHGTNDQICYGTQETMRKQCKMYDNVIILKQNHVLTACLHPEEGVLKSYIYEGLETIHDENLIYELQRMNTITFYKDNLHVIFNTNEKNFPIVNLATKYFCKYNAPNMFNLTVVANKIPENEVHPIHDSRWTINYKSGGIGFCPSGTHFGPTMTKVLNEIKEDYIFFFCDDYILTSAIDFEKLNTLLLMMDREEIDYFSFASSEPKRFGFKPYTVKDMYNIEKDRFYYMDVSYRHAFSVQPCIWKRSSLLEVLKYNPHATLHAMDNSSLADKSGYYRSFKTNESTWYEPWPTETDYKFKMLCTDFKIFDLCCPPEKFIISYREVIRHGRFHIKENGYGGVEGYHGQEFITRLIEDEKLKLRPEYAKYLPQDDKTGVNT